jgi:hypothetical protein
MSIGFDINAEKWISIWKLNSMANPDYYETMRKYFENLCLSMGRRDLVEELARIISVQLEEPMGSKWESILFTYKNLPALNSFTKSNNPEYHSEYVRKYELKVTLEGIESWIFSKLVEMESDIRFQDRQSIM